MCSCRRRYFIFTILRTILATILVQSYSLAEDLQISTSLNPITILVIEDSECQSKLRQTLTWMHAPEMSTTGKRAHHSPITILVFGAIGSTLVDAITGQAQRHNPITIPVLRDLPRF